MKEQWKRILMANLPALICVLVMSVMLKFALGYSLFLSFFVLLILYFVLGLGIELLLEWAAIKSAEKSEAHAVNRKSQSGMRGGRAAEEETEKLPPSKIFSGVPQDEPKKDTKRVISGSSRSEQIKRQLIRTKTDFRDLKSAEDSLGPSKSDVTPVRSPQGVPKAVPIIHDVNVLLQREPNAGKAAGKTQDKIKESEKQQKLADGQSWDREGTSSEVPEKQPEMRGSREMPERTEASEQPEIAEMRSNSMYEDFTIDSVENLNRESDRIQEEVERRVGSGLRGTKRRKALDLDFTLPIDQIEPDASDAKKKDTVEKSDSPQNIAFSEESPFEPIFSEALPPEVIPEETLSSGRPIIEETDVESITEASDDRPEIAGSAEPPAGSGSSGGNGSSENGDKVKADQNKIDHLFQTEDEPPRKSFFGFKKKRGGNNKSF